MSGVDLGGVTYKLGLPARRGMLLDIAVLASRNAHRGAAISLIVCLAAGGASLKPPGSARALTLPALSDHGYDAGAWSDACLEIIDAMRWTISEWTAAARVASELVETAVPCRGVSESEVAAAGNFSGATPAPSPS